MLAQPKEVLASLFGLLVCSRTPAAQCPLPDGLDGGPCCTVAAPTVPGFPRFDQDGIEICWRDCDVEQVIPYRASWNNLHVLPSVDVQCVERRVRLDLKDAAGVLQWTGTLRLQYSRTWLETDPVGLPLQVWRFLVNGDMHPVAPMPSPCPVPSCAPVHANKVRFTGYVDYAASCAVVPTHYQHAWMLTHACDTIDHHAGFPRAGTFHPNRAYTFVGPAAGFVPGPIQPTEGTPGSSLEAVRDDWPFDFTPGTCAFEEQMTFSLEPVQQLCLGGPALGPLQYLIGDLTINGSCPTFILAPGDPLLPGFISMGIGSWTIGGTYPGVERLRWVAGCHDYADPCTFLPVLRREVFFGVTTIGGYPATQLTAGGPGAPLPLTFIDQSNSRTPPIGRETMNVPYVSHCFHNLNH